MPQISHLFTKPEVELACQLFESGAIETLETPNSSAVIRQMPWGAHRGFQTREHRLDPTLPLAPFNLNIHAPSVHPELNGPLTQKTIDLSSACMHRVATKAGFGTYEVAIGNPLSGHLFAAPIAKISNRKNVEFKKLTGRSTVEFERLSNRTRQAEFKKVPRRSVYYIVQGNLPLGTRRVLVVDNVVRHGESMGDLIEILRETGAEIVGGVTLIDWGLDGSDRLLTAGCKLVSVFTLRQLFAIANEEGVIKKATYDQVINYLNICHYQL
jgi:adenine/guanine phosphoribosyltransferase-like PRPP-binding protein